MAQWGRNDQSVTANSTTTTETSTGAPIGTYALVNGGTGVMGGNSHFGNTSAGSRANLDVNLFNNVTSGAFIPNQVVGVFGVSVTEQTNNTLNSSTLRSQPAHAGWVIRREGTGPVVSATGTGGSGFVTGDTAKVSNASSNAVLYITANVTGNVSSVTVSNGGAGWANTSMANVTFDRLKYLTSITVAGTPTGYNNTDIITISNATSTYSGRATISTNATGGFVTANVTIANTGLFSNTQTNTGLVFAVSNSTGGSSSGSGATFTGGLVNSTGGSITITLGGRAGRVHCETLVAMGSLGANTTSSTGVVGAANTVTDSATDNTQFPGV